MSSMSAVDCPTQVTMVLEIFLLSIFNCVTLERELLLGLEFNPDLDSNVDVLFFWILFCYHPSKVKRRVNQRSATISG